MRRRHAASGVREELAALEREAVVRYAGIGWPRTRLAALLGDGPVAVSGWEVGAADHDGRFWLDAAGNLTPLDHTAARGQDA